MRLSVPGQAPTWTDVDTHACTEGNSRMCIHTGTHRCAHSRPLRAHLRHTRMPQLPLCTLTRTLRDLFTLTPARASPAPGISGSVRFYVFPFQGRPISESSA